VPLYPCIADITEEGRMRQIFTRHSVDVVFHAAAHKHVPMLELNPGEAIKNNVLGTKCVADLSHRYGVHAFVMISTDKAVNPSSVMGLTKQLAERYVQSLSKRSRTRFVAVRFGNVLGSSGSVVPIFQEQIRNGGPLTITHPEMQRFFMTIPEASQLVLQAAASGQGGEVFVLDMGEPVNIVDLARDLIRLSGARPEDIAIVYTGVRPGEKAFEELHSNSEHLLPSEHPKIWVVEGPPVDLPETKDAIATVSAVLREPDDVIRRVLRDVVLQSREAPDACAFGVTLLATDQEVNGDLAVTGQPRESLVAPKI
jgi:FlaA1/EpsC-like NDP-sugar epimerase